MPSASHFGSLEHGEEKGEAGEAHAGLETALDLGEGVVGKHECGSTFGGGQGKSVWYRERGMLDGAGLKKNLQCR